MLKNEFIKRLQLAISECENPLPQLWLLRLYGPEHYQASNIVTDFEVVPEKRVIALETIDGKGPLSPMQLISHLMSIPGDFPIVAVARREDIEGYQIVNVHADAHGIQLWSDAWLHAVGTDAAKEAAKKVTPVWFLYALDGTLDEQRA
jgi:hypothetical protein